MWNTNCIKNMKIKNAEIFELIQSCNCLSNDFLKLRNFYYDLVLLNLQKSLHVRFIASTVIDIVKFNNSSIKGTLLQNNPTWNIFGGKVCLIIFINSFSDAATDASTFLYQTWYVKSKVLYSFKFLLWF